MPMSIRLPAEIEERLGALSALTGRSKTFYATQAIIEQIDDLEDAYLAEEVLARIRAGTEKTVPLNTLLADYGLAN